jgi:hypothetical protein
MLIEMYINYFSMPQGKTQHGITQFADMTQEEFQNRVLMRPPPLPTEKRVRGPTYAGLKVCTTTSSSFVSSFPIRRLAYTPAALPPHLAVRLCDSRLYLCAGPDFVRLAQQDGRRDPRVQPGPVRFVLVCCRAFHQLHWSSRERHSRNSNEEN